MTFAETSVRSFAFARRTDPWGRPFLCLRFLSDGDRTLLDVLLSPMAARMLANTIAEFVQSFGAAFLIRRTKMIDDPTVVFVSRKRYLTDKDVEAFGATAMLVDLSHAAVADAIRLSIDCAGCDTLDLLLDVDLCIQLSALFLNP